MNGKEESSKPLIVVTIPDDLTQFLRNVHSLILTGDAAAMNESDDMLQSERVYGGLVEQEGDLYGFTYFPSDGIDPKWEIFLTRKEIAEIANDRMSELSLYCCNHEGCGNRYTDASGVCYKHSYV